MSAASDALTDALTLWAGERVVEYAQTVSDALATLAAGLRDGTEPIDRDLAADIVVELAASLETIAIETWGGAS